MSAADAEKALAMIQRAKARGRAVDLTFKRKAAVDPDDYDPNGGTTPVDLSWMGTAVVLPASQGTVEAFDVRFEAGTLIESKLRALIIAALGMERAPAPGDTVLFPDGSVGSLLGCTPLNPDVANPIIYQGTVKL